MDVIMSNFETTAITVPYRHRCEDQVKVLDFDDGVVIAVADGAGGTGAGGDAAETVIREITASASLEHDEAAWCRILQQIDFRVGVGESTCVVVACTLGGLVGASVGDSQAWFIANGVIEDLTKNRVRKPLLGSGEAIPIGFSHPSAQGLLLVATDGFCNYVRHDQLLKEILWIDFAVLARKLAEMVRLPSGELWDDIGIVACKPRPKTDQRRRYNLVNRD
jgi:PPM family protein phosphatase